MDDTTVSMTEQGRTADGQTLVAAGRDRWEAEQSDTTANPLADAPAKAVSGTARSSKTINADASEQTEINGAMAIIPRPLESRLSDGWAGTQEANALYNGNAPEGFAEEEARSHGETLPQWEERIGKVDAGIEVTGRAGSGHEATGDEREQANREAVADMCAPNRLTHDGSPFLAQLDADNRRRVIDEATRLSDKYERVNERVAVKVLARFTAVHGLLDGVKQARNHLLRNVATTLSDIDTDVAEEADAIVEVTYLKPDDERDDSKAVAASIRGDDGELGHLTIWENSTDGQYDTVDSLWFNTTWWNGIAEEIETTNLREGDRLLIRDAAVSEFKGEVSLALTSGSTLEILDKGDGRTVGNTAEYNGETTQNPRRCTGAGVKSQTNVDNSKMT